MLSRFREPVGFPELAVAVSGTVSMGLEILAGRILAPEFGGSIYTWGSIIGVFMASLSLGYYVGGRRAGEASKRRISKILALAAVYIALLLSTSDFIIRIADIMPLGVHYSAIPAVVALFGPPAYILGLISPYAAELSGKPGKGEASGQIFAFGTLGSIFGAFATTFVLIPLFAVDTVFMVLGAALIAASIIYGGPAVKLFAFLAVVLLVGSYAMSYAEISIGREVVYSTQTPYQELTVSDRQGVRTLYLNGQPNSAMYLNGSDQHVYSYTRYFHLPMLMSDDVDRVLFIGGGGFTGPKRFVNDYNVTVDVVEIDPGVVNAAEKYFDVNESEDLNIYVMDGREYLEKTNRTYDVIVLDAYRKDEVPFHLTTLEFMELVEDRLDTDGVVLSNVISAPSGPGSQFFRSEYRTMERAFPGVYAFPTSNTPLIQNIEIVAARQSFTEEELLRRNREEDIGIDLSGEIRNYKTGVKTSDVPVLTDEHAPVDRLLVPEAKEYVVKRGNTS